MLITGITGAIPQVAYDMLLGCHLATGKYVRVTSGGELTPKPHPGGFFSGNYSMVGGFEKLIIKNDK